MSMYGSSFCSNQSLLSHENLIGTVPLTKVYVLIEHKQPWANEALESKDITQELRLITEKYRKFAQFILISNQYTKQKDEVKVIFYIMNDNEQLQRDFTSYEAEFSNYEQIYEVIKNYFVNQQLPSTTRSTKNRNLLICTHGGFDRCCGKYGKPFYIKSNEILHNLSADEKVEIWESSHFGGHRFAPTMIDFPDGRYYGRLNEDIFTSIINRTGELTQTLSSYRGWSILPKVAQVVEKQLILDIGWQWFNASAASYIQLLEDGESYDVKIRYLLEHKERLCCARVLKSSQPLKIKIRCQNKVESIISQFVIDSFEYLQQSNIQK
jgi:hypothetical protein